MSFLLRRCAFYLFTAWAALTINFLIPRLMPGDPVQAVIGRYQGKITPEGLDSLYVLFGLDEDQSLWEQYVAYWGQLAHGDLGLAFSQFPTPVWDVLKAALPWTLVLVGVATVISFVVGTLVGIVLGWRRGTWADSILPVTAFFATVPYFWLAIILISVFAVTWPILPASQGYDGGVYPGWDWGFVSSAIYHSVLPAVTIVLTSVAGWILGMRNMMMTVTSEDYVTVAHAKGLSERRVMLAYAARNAVLPQVSGFALALGFIVSGTLVMEIVFSYPGIGYLILGAITAQDYPLLQGLFLIITMSVLLASLLADVVYIFLDPRTRQEG